MSLLVLVYKIFLGYVSKYKNMVKNNMFFCEIFALLYLKLAINTEKMQNIYFQNIFTLFLCKYALVDIPFERKTLKIWNEFKCNNWMGTSCIMQFKLPFWLKKLTFNFNSLIFLINMLSQASDYLMSIVWKNTLKK